MFPEHFEVGKPKYTLIDLDQQKIVKTSDIPKEEEAMNQGDRGVGAWIFLRTANCCINLAIRSRFCRRLILRYSTTSTWQDLICLAWRISAMAAT